MKDVLFIADGYLDQLGRESGFEKFMYYRFRELLLRIASQEMEKQKQALIESFNCWKGDQSQIDDILIIGFRNH